MVQIHVGAPIFNAPVPQQLQGEFRKLVFVGASPTGGSISGSWCNSSISPCEGDGPGANPGFLTKLVISNFVRNQRAVQNAEEVGENNAGGGEGFRPRIYRH